MLMVRKGLIGCSALLLLLLMLPAAVYGAESPAVTLSVSNTTPLVGQSIQITVKAEQISDLYAYELSLYYDPAQLEFQSGSEKTGIKGFSIPAKISESGGHHLVYALTKTGATATETGKADLVTFTFVAKQSSTALLQLKDVKLIDSKLVQSGVMPAAEAVIAISDGTATNPPGTDSGNSNVETGIVAITNQQFLNAVENKTAITIPANSIGIRIPFNASELLGSNHFMLQKSGMKLEIPVEILNQLESMVSAEQHQSSSIVLLLESLSADKKDEAIRKASEQSGAVIKAAGGLYSLSLYVETEDGIKHELKKFNKSMTIYISVDTSVDEKLAGIYYVTESGKLEYVGGDIVNGELIAEINHFSLYALLEVNKSFTDISDNFWAASVIKELAAKQIVTGTSLNSYEPARSVTRAEFTALLVRALKLTDGGTSSFVDVEANAWYAGDINAAVKAGLIHGRSETVFGPNEKITREEMAALVVRAYEFKHGASSNVTGSVFNDESQMSTWAISDVSKAAKLGLVQGRGDNMFVPKGISNRAEAAQVIYNLLNK